MKQQQEEAAAKAAEEEAAAAEQAAAEQAAAEQAAAEQAAFEAQKQAYKDNADFVYEPETLNGWVISANRMTLARMKICM